MNSARLEGGAQAKNCVEYPPWEISSNDSNESSLGFHDGQPHAQDDSDADSESFPDIFNEAAGPQKRRRRFTKKVADIVASQKHKRTGGEKLKFLKEAERRYFVPSHLLKDINLMKNLDLEKQLYRDTSQLDLAANTPPLQFPIELYIKSSPYVRNLEMNFQDLQKAFLMINSQFGQLQFRLVQLLNTPPEQRDGLLDELRHIIFNEIEETEVNNEWTGGVQQKITEDIYQKQEELIQEMRTNFAAMMSELNQFDLRKKSDPEEPESEVKTESDYGTEGASDDHLEPMGMCLPHPNQRASEARPRKSFWKRFFNF